MDPNSSLDFLFILPSVSNSTPRRLRHGLTGDSIILTFLTSGFLVLDGSQRRFPIAPAIPTLQLLTSIESAATLPTRAGDRQRKLADLRDPHSHDRSSLPASPGSYYIIEMCEANFRWEFSVNASQIRDIISIATGNFHICECQWTDPHHAGRGSHKWGKDGVIFMPKHKHHATLLATNSKCNLGRLIPKRGTDTANGARHLACAMILNNPGETEFILLRMRCTGAPFWISRCLTVQVISAQRRTASVKPGFGVNGVDYKWKLCFSLQPCKRSVRPLPRRSVFVEFIKTLDHRQPQSLKMLGPEVKVRVLRAPTRSPEWFEISRKLLQRFSVQNASAGARVRVSQQHDAGQDRCVIGETDKMAASCHRVAQQLAETVTLSSEME
ncbi:hypothetical protein C8R44DRAFT_740337 [Mycena epipterygia]|nr:hypothetical protein C8R44DRAFT_740337 [Mycena epipterygia]